MSTTFCLFFFNDTATTEIYTLSLHDALPISATAVRPRVRAQIEAGRFLASLPGNGLDRRLDVAALRAMAQRVIHQHAGEHCLRDRRRADAHARVVAAGGLHRGRLAFAVDRAARKADARGRLRRDAHQDVLAGRDAAQRSARVVREKTLRRQLVAVLGAFLLDRGEAGTDLHAFDGVDAHHRRSDVGVEPAVDRLAPADRNAARDDVHPRAAGIARSAQFVHELLESRHDGRIRREKRIFVDRIPRLERDRVRAELREMPAHLDAIPLAQPFLGDRSRGDADHGLASGGPAAAAIVAQAVFLPVRVVGVTGAEGVGERAVVPAPLVFVSDDKTDRRARGPALENAREDLDAVGLLALRDVAGAAGLAPVELSLDVAFRELEPGRTAVHDAAIRGPVALAKRSHAIQQAEGVAGHGKSRKERSASLA